MAFIGMRHVVVAKVATHSAGSEPTYSAGMVAGKAITGNLTINRNNNPLYADDVIAEDDNGITSMELELGLEGRVRGRWGDQDLGEAGRDGLS
jgi:hypothetical protein